jgi:hypothetical protein
MRRSILTFVLALGLAVSVTAARAATPDNQTPSRESVCDELTGSARGACNAYCEAQDCDEHHRPSCNSLRRKYQKLTGSPVFPCDMLPCGYASGPQCGGACPTGEACRYLGEFPDEVGIPECMCWPITD